MPTRSREFGRQAFNNCRLKVRRFGRNAEGIPYEYISMDQSFSRVATGTQVTVSDGHPWPPSRGSTDDVGGPFYTRKTYVTNKLAHKNFKFTKVVIPGGPPSASDEVTYSGPIAATDPNSPLGGLPPDASSTSTKLDELGATAVSRTVPTNSIASLSTALGEIVTGGLPHLVGSTLWKKRAQAPRDAGSEYLNVQFGWLPLINDISEFASGVSKAGTVLTQYERDAGRVVRRGYDFPMIHSITTNTTENTPVWGPSSSLFYRNGRQLTFTRETSIRRWFRGAYTYYLPSGYDSRSKLDRYKLFADRIGLEISPEVLWELTPWSWAVDWFSNAGDVISNVSAFQQDGLVMRYGYIMEHSIVKDTYTMTGATTDNGVPLPVDPVIIVTETKVRRQANPYGFGVSWDGLSSFQTSILAALGISRGRR